MSRSSGNLHSELSNRSLLWRRWLKQIGLPSLAPKKQFPMHPWPPLSPAAKVITSHHLPRPKHIILTSVSFPFDTEYGSVSCPDSCVINLQIRDCIQRASFEIMNGSILPSHMFPDMALMLQKRVFLPIKYSYKTIWTGKSCFSVSTISVSI